MNFEVFEDRELWCARIDELEGKGCIVVADFNGRAYTIKWKE